ncbi:hypothetical protein D1841_11540 [Neglecta sp. X4]|nr:hypothetical protein [Neglectibacter sp. 59]NBJ73895.1 hypothetical protein [Neglectibacter sp. X4]NCE81667.1 hypothetical protein [Neglectibacter sp. X58]
MRGWRLAGGGGLFCGGSPPLHPRQRANGPLETQSGWVGRRDTPPLPRRKHGTRGSDTSLDFPALDFSWGMPYNEMDTGKPLTGRSTSRYPF